MATHTILSPLQRVALFDPPGDPAIVQRVYTLGPEDLVEVFRRRRASNRLGFAVQLCYLRHPGRPLEPGEAPPSVLLDVIAAQIECGPDDFGEYAGRETTLREHRAEIEAWLGLRTFERPDRSAMLAVAVEVAAATYRGEAIVAAMIGRLRAARIVLPAASTLERVARVARAAARAKPSRRSRATSRRSSSTGSRCCCRRTVWAPARHSLGCANGRRRRAPVT